MELNFGVALVFVILILGIVAILIASMWFGAKKKENDKGDKPIDPLMRTLQMSLVIILIFIVLLFVTGKKITKEWIFLFFVLIIVIYWINWQYLKKLKPVPIQELIKKGIDLTREMLNTEVCVGETFGLNFKLWKVTENPGGTLLDSVANIVIVTNVGTVLLKLNVYTSYCVYFHPVPPQDIIEKIYDESIGKQYDAEREKLIQKVNVEKDTGEMNEEV